MYAGKWKVSYEEWPWTSYPQYLFGASILISGKALSLLLDAAQVTPYFGMEDIYLTGLVARKAGIRLRPTDRYSFEFMHSLFMQFIFISASFQNVYSRWKFKNI